MFVRMEDHNPDRAKIPGNGTSAVALQFLNKGSISTQRIFDNDQRQVRMILTQLLEKTLGRITFTIVLRGPILLDDRFRRQRDDGFVIRMHNGGSQHLMRVGDGAILMFPVQTRLAMHC